MAKIEVEAFTCDRCGHVWSPRNKSAEPRVCPKCKSPYWNTPRKRVTYAPGKTRLSALREAGLKAAAPAPSPAQDEEDSFWHPKTFEELAKEQGVHPVQNWEDLVGGWPEDADFEEFMEAIRHARRGD